MTFTLWIKAIPHYIQAYFTTFNVSTVVRLLNTACAPNVTQVQLGAWKSRSYTGFLLQPQWQTYFHFPLSCFSLPWHCNVCAGMLMKTNRRKQPLCWIKWGKEGGRDGGRGIYMKAVQLEHHFPFLWRLGNNKIKGVSDSNPKWLAVSASLLKEWDGDGEEKKMRGCGGERDWRKRYDGVKSVEILRVFGETFRRIG